MGSNQQLLDDFTTHIGEPKISPLELVGQPGVIQTKQMQNRGLQVVDVDLVFHDVVAEFVGGAERDALLDACPGQPDRERARMVVAAQKL